MFTGQDEHVDINYYLKCNTRELATFYPCSDADKVLQFSILNVRGKVSRTFG